MAETLVSAWRATKRRLEAAGLEGPVIDARLLVEAAAEASRADIISDPHRPIGPDQERRLEAYVERRLRREPVSQILGRKGFWKIVLGVNDKVLTPRPESETLVETALARFAPGQAFRVLDLGVGSGAVLLALLAERPLADGLGVDISPDALAVARENAATLGLDGRAALSLGDWTAGLASASFDLALANPPYIPSGQIESLAPEVRDHEPRLALDGGPEGLCAYRVLAPEMLRVLKSGGIFAVEIDPDQRRQVEALFGDADAQEVRAVNDLAGRARVITGVKKDLG
ncbi:MAG: peptide chain release factor N(5)-glutamine methyltransferase [Caulobacteraceae bacterium]